MGGLCLGASAITAARGWLPWPLQMADTSDTVSPQRWAWYAVHDLVKSICKFRREMDNDKHRAEFEDFLRWELGNEEESMARFRPPPLLPPQDSPGFRQRRKWRKPVAHLPSPYADLVFSAEGIQRPRSMGVSGYQILLCRNLHTWVLESGDEVQNFAQATCSHTHPCNIWFSDVGCP